MFFSGETKKQKVSLVVRSLPKQQDKSTILEQAKVDRLNRQTKRKEESSSILIQKNARRFLCQRKYSRQFLLEIEKNLIEIQVLLSNFKSRNINFQLPLATVVEITRKFAFLNTNSSHRVLRIFTLFLELVLLPSLKSGSIEYSLFSHYKNGTISSPVDVYLTKVIRLVVSILEFSKMNASLNSSSEYTNLHAALVLLIETVCDRSNIPSCINFPRSNELPFLIRFTRSPIFQRILVEHVFLPFLHPSAVNKLVTNPVLSLESCIRLVLESCVDSHPDSSQSNTKHDHIDSLFLLFSIQNVSRNILSMSQPVISTHELLEKISSSILFQRSNQFQESIKAFISSPLISIHLLDNMLSLHEYANRVYSDKFLLSLHLLSSKLPSNWLTYHRAIKMNFETNVHRLKSNFVDLSMDVDADDSSDLEDVDVEQMKVLRNPDAALTSSLKDSTSILKDGISIFPPFSGKSNIVKTSFYSPLSTFLSSQIQQFLNLHSDSTLPLVGIEEVNARLFSQFNVYPFIHWMKENYARKPAILFLMSFLGSMSTQCRTLQFLKQKGLVEDIFAISILKSPEVMPIMWSALFEGGIDQMLDRDVSISFFQPSSNHAISFAASFFFNSMSSLLFRMNDMEFSKLFPSPNDYANIVFVVKTILYRIVWHDSMATSTPLPERPYRLLLLMSSLIYLYNDLFERFCRKSLTMCSGDSWLWPSLSSTDVSVDVVLGLADERIEDLALSSQANANAMLLDAEIPPPPTESMTAPLLDASPTPQPPSLGGVRFAGKKGLLQARLQLVLSCVPFTIPFHTRVRLFHALRDADKERLLGGPRNLFFFQVPSKLHVRVRRDHLVEDAFQAFDKIARGDVSMRLNQGGDENDEEEEQMNRRNSTPVNLKNDFRIEFINSEGLPEAGIDGGGLLKEFIDSLVKKVFDPTIGLLTVTSDNLLYPSPNLDLMLGGKSSRDRIVNHRNVLQYYQFLGQLLGKALYEGILIEPRFSLFFLRKLLGKSNSFDDLRSLDVDLYKQLLRLPSYSDDEIRALQINFELSTSSSSAVQLVPNGHAVQLTKENCFLYMHLVANHKLNTEIAVQTRALLQGFRSIIPLSWIQMFGSFELQTLIGGSDTPGFDVADLRANTGYTGGFANSQPYVEAFWEVLSEFSTEDKTAFLMFTTSCTRPPLLGFKALNPKFGLQQVYEIEKLPSAATCFNQLKLPKYASKEELRKKLLFAIHSGAGFELT
jgi:HECT-domain (ubiquitin-transferase)